MATFPDLVTAVAKANGVPPPRVRPHGPGVDPKATTTRWNTVLYGSAVEDEPEAVQAWTAAHEVAHIALRHNQAFLWELPAAILLVGGTFTAAVLWAPTEGATLGFFACALMMLLWVAAHLPISRARERHADALALRWGYPVTRQVAEYLPAADPSNVWARLLRTHDAPQDRINDDHQELR